MTSVSRARSLTSVFWPLGSSEGYGIKKLAKRYDAFLTSEALIKPSSFDLHKVGHFDNDALTERDPLKKGALSPRDDKRSMGHPTSCCPSRFLVEEELAKRQRFEVYLC